jgi:hypothetical protein
MTFQKALKANLEMLANRNHFIIAESEIDDLLTFQKAARRNGFIAEKIGNQIFVS